MKILDAWINDPTFRGEIEPPVLHIAVDQLPDITIPIESFSGGWQVGKYGPFVSYACLDDDKNFVTVDAGDYNIKFRTRFPPVVDVILSVTYEDENGCEQERDYPGYSLPLNRARQLLRKHDSSWRLLLNDRAASDEGKLLWVPIQTHAVCRYWQPATHGVCGSVPARAVRVRGTDVPMCDSHIKLHNDIQAARRAAKAS